MKEFDVEKETGNVIAWIRSWFADKGSNAKVIIGVSGGIDSTTTGKLCAKALGPDNVIGVRLPCGEQKDIDDAKLACEELGIKSIEINIGDAYEALTKEICSFGEKGIVLSPTDQYTTNTPARLRMTALYGVAAMVGNAYPVGTGNITEDSIGYSTLYGDTAASFDPILAFTKDEVRAIAKYLGLSERLYNKVSIDGMSLNEDGTYKPDEDKLGFSYKEIGDLIRYNIKGPNYDKIVEMYHKNKFKNDLIRLPHYDPGLPNFLENL